MRTGAVSGLPVRGTPRRLVLSVGAWPSAWVQYHVLASTVRSQLRIPIKSATYSDRKPATHSG